MASEIPTPEWAETKIDQIRNGSPEEQLDAVLELLAAIAPTIKEQKYKHDIAWAAIDHGWKQTEHCKKSCRRHLGVAV